MNKYPKISIITVTYNSEAHLEEAIQSVVGQDYGNIEYIVIDGGSTDKTLDIINKYKEHIAYFVSEPDKGISDAFNKGIKAATGDFIQILNSDDFLMKGSISSAVNQFEDGYDVFRGYCTIWNEELNIKRNLYPNNRFKVPPVGAVICHESAFISHKAYDTIGEYKVDFRYMMDLDYFIRLYKDGRYKSKFIDTCVITFRTGGASSSPAYKLKNERKRLILENGGSKLCASLFLFYHDVKYRIKLLRNGIYSFIKK